MRKFTGMRHTALAKETSKSKRASVKARYPRFVVCLDNRGNEISLDIGKIYQVIRPEKRDPPSLLRIIDNEGEDYLYNAIQFVPVDLVPRAKKVLRQRSLFATAGAP